MVDTDNAKSNASSRNSPRTWVTSLIKTRVSMYSCSLVEDVLNTPHILRSNSITPHVLRQRT
ncbi:hypothetical protein M405DRAFT_803855, partial [Rhizopogon salebrosus TDB-379]